MHHSGRFRYIPQTVHRERKERILDLKHGVKELVLFAQFRDTAAAGRPGLLFVVALLLHLGSTTVELGLGQPLLIARFMFILVVALRLQLRPLAA